MIAEEATRWLWWATQCRGDIYVADIGMAYNTEEEAVATSRSLIRYPQHYRLRRNCKRLETSRPYRRRAIGQSRQYAAG